MNDPLAMLFAEKYGFKWDQCSVMAETVRAFLAERVTKETLAKAIKDMRVDGMLIVITWSGAGELAEAILALLQRKMGGA